MTKFKKSWHKAFLHWMVGNEFIQMKGHTLFQEEIIMKWRKYRRNLKIFFSRSTLAFKFVQIRGPPLNENTFTKFINIFLQNHWAYFNQTWHKSSLRKANSSCYAIFQGRLLRNSDNLKSPEVIGQFQPNWHNLEVLQIRTIQFSKRR